MNTQEKPFLLTVSEVAQILRIQRAKVYLLIESEALKAAKIGNAWRVRTDSLEKLVGEIQWH